MLGGTASGRSKHFEPGSPSYCLPRRTTMFKSKVAAVALCLAMLLPAAQNAAHAATAVQKWVTMLCWFANDTAVTENPPTYFQEQWDGTAPGLDHYWRE